MAQTERFDSAELYDQAILGLRNQLWVAILLMTLSATVITRLLRYLAGVQSTPLAIALQVAFYSVIVAGLLLRNTRHAQTIQTGFLLCVHLAMPLIILVYGGTRGFGDIMLFMCLLISILYGWRRWMALSFAVSTAAFAYSLYLEAAGRPLRPLLDNTTSFVTLKTLIFIVLVSFTLYMGQRFYQQLIDKHQLYVDAQSRLTTELEQHTKQLEQLNSNLQQSRQQIVTTREEERRRLRRDLQERIGPTLASLGHRAGAARNTLTQRPQQAQIELNKLESTIKETLQDVRHFVYALYPPMLDQLGLIGAIRQHLDKQKPRFVVKLNLPTEDVELPASAEITAFRLVETMLSLAIERGTTTDMSITLQIEALALRLEIVDDGVESAETLLTAQPMLRVRQQIDEQGGTLAVTAIESGGVCIKATLSL